jgi:hypothetical protein
MKKEKPKTESVEIKNKLLVTIINRGFAEQVISHSRAAGATGATILDARASADVGEKFMGMNITPEKEIILIVVPEALSAGVMNAISSNMGIASKAGGVCFSVPLHHFYKHTAK